MLYLLDTGPLVALFNVKDAHHHAVTHATTLLNGGFLTTMPVVTEAMYFLQDVPGGQARLVDFLASSDTIVHACNRPEEFRAALGLMQKYADVPMDFADASLVLVAESTGLRDIFTLDRRGFRTFRAHGRQAFHLLLDDLIS